MDFRLPLFSFVFVVGLTAVLAVSHAALPSEVYWHEVLPNTRMPSFIRDLLHQDLVDEKTDTSVNVGKGGVHVEAGKGTPKSGTTVDVGSGGVHVDTGKGTPKSGPTIDVGKGGVHVDTGKGNLNGGTSVNVGSGGVGVNTGHNGNPVVVHVGPPGGKPSPFNYNYAASEDQLHDDPNVAIFFLEKNLHPSAKMNLGFTKTADGPTFLPRGVAKTIPFSSSKVSDILNRFSIAPGSPDAEAVKDTLQTCEAPPSKGEDKLCATSLESMVDFARSKLGTNVQVLSTTVDKETGSQQYTIGSGVEKMGGPSSVACHGQSYMYAVYYCHETHDTVAYKVPLVRKDGTSVEAVAVCHKDTSAWNPRHLAFQVLKVKPGSVPICHFLPEDHLLWVSN
ncbi:BURP domain protein RD22-like [Tasmannia lanceolata]|uniref:BURP domain protein RD22-like n=1 Tax=Tasmannia lanceolata TaxID=3420 RepID=UPI004064BFF8